MSPRRRAAALRQFFPGRKESIGAVLRSILAGRKGKRTSDAQLQWILKTEYDIVLSRRTVNYYRNCLREK